MAQRFSAVACNAEFVQGSVLAVPLTLPLTFTFINDTLNINLLLLSTFLSLKKGEFLTAHIYVHTQTNTNA